MSDLQRKRKRVISSVVVSVLSLAIFGFSVSVASADRLTAELKTAYKNGVQSVLLQANTVHKSIVVYEEHFPSFHGGKYTPVLTSEQLETLEKHTTVMPVVYAGVLSDDSFGYYKDTLAAEEEKDIYYRMGLVPVQRLIELHPQTGTQDAMLKPDKRLTVECRLPQTFEEVAITDYMADMFLRFGYRDKDGDGGTCEISSPDDLIGKRFLGLTICGVYETDEDKAELQEKAERFNGSEDDTRRWMLGEHTMKYAFVCKGFAAAHSETDSVVGYNVLYRLSGDIEKDKDLIKALSYTEYKTYDGLRDTTYQKIDFSAGVRTRYSVLMESTEIGLMQNGWALTAAFAVSFLLAVIGGALLKSAYAQEREGRGGCVLKLCLITLVEYLVSLCIVGGGCMLANVLLGVELFALGILPIVLTAVFAFANVAFWGIRPMKKK